VHFIAERFSVYYERRLLDFVHNRRPRVSTQFPPYAGQLIEKVGDDIYNMASSEHDAVVYTVNMAVVICTCLAGSAGKLCKHIHYVLAVSDDYGDQLCNYLNDFRDLFYLVATGHSSDSTPSELLDTLHEGTDQLESGSDNDDTHSNSMICAPNVQDSLDNLGDFSCESRADVERKITEWTELVKVKIHDLARSNPRVFSEAYTSSINTLHSISTVDDAVSALNVFGKYSAEDPILAKRRKLSTFASRTVDDN